MYDTTGMRQVGNLWELTEDLHGSPYYNDDLAPTTTARRTWNTWHIAALWIGMAVCIPTYMLAGGLIRSGMSWWQAVGTILLGNLIVLVPMCLNAHAGTKYGVPFPVLLRGPFGVLGSNIPALMRAAVACGWFGIQTWIGGQAIYELMGIFYPERLAATPIIINLDLRPHLNTDWNVGLNGWQALCFLLFWFINVFVVLRGINSIKWMESLSAPFLIAVGLALLVWAAKKDGLGNALERSNQFKGKTMQVSIDGAKREATLTLRPVRDGDAWRAREYQVATSKEALGSAEWRPIPAPGEKLDFFTATVPLPTSAKAGDSTTFYARVRDAERVTSSVLDASGRFDPASRGGESTGGVGFWIGLTGMIGFWATLSLNIPDFTRFARSQKAQVSGQFLGLPTTMALYSFIGVAVTCAAVGIFHDVLIVDDAPGDPVKLLARFKEPWVVALSMFALMIATLTTNVAANVVSPANDLSNLAPTKIGFRLGGFITALVGMLIMPWLWMNDPGLYIGGWLVGSGSLLGPIGGIMIADYYLVRRAQLRLPDLYKRYGIYRYCGGFSLMALFVLAVAILPNLPGWLAHVRLLDQTTLEGLVRSLATSLNLTWDVQTIATQILSLYQYSWFLGFGIAFVLYTLFGLIVRKV